MKCENCGEEFTEENSTCPECGHKQKKEKTEDEGVAKGNSILWWALFVLFLGIGGTFIAGLIFIKEPMCVVIWLVGGVSSILAYIFISGWGIIVKKISLIEQHINKKK